MFFLLVVVVVAVILMGVGGGGGRGPLKTQNSISNNLNLLVNTIKIIFGSQ